MQKLRIDRADGRYVYLYAAQHPLPAPLAVTQAPRADDALEARWNPLLDEYVIVSAGRQERTFLPPDDRCPLCPTVDASSFATEIPASAFELAVFENRFPALRIDAADVTDDAPLERRSPAHGLCEVVVYSAQHDATLASLPDAQLGALVDVWTDRYAELAASDEIHYVFIFENRGREIGVTLTHPHGQIYAFPFIPPRVAREYDAMREHARRAGGCLICDTVAQEISHNRRIIVAAEGWVAYVPFAARLPYEVHLALARHGRSLLDLTAPEREGLAHALRVVQQKYDNLWGVPMPYTMYMHQAATDGRERPGDHLHIEFAPLLRSRDRLKYIAGVETGAGTYLNDTSPEEKAQELREAEPRT